MKTSRTIIVGLGLITGSLTSLKAASYSSTVLGDNPFAYYRLGESTNASPVADEKTNSPGTYVNSPTVGVSGAIATDPTNTAVAFTRSASQYLSLTNLGNYGSSLTSGFTIEYWLKTADSTDNQTIIGIANTPSFGTDLQMDIANAGTGDLRLYIRDDAGNRYEGNVQFRPGRRGRG
jgi:hypothetical protein